MLDRWLWLKARLPITRNHENLIDIGCGTGAFSIGAALRGYQCLGLSWDERNQAVAAERAKQCGAERAEFEVLDVRQLDSRSDLVGRFDIAVCFENIEHILDDRRLMRAMAACLKPGARLYLTSPYVHYRPMSVGDMGPFHPIEDGGHVRRGYSPAMLAELCEDCGLVPDGVSYCSGVLSQWITSLQRCAEKVHHLFAWGLILPLRVLPPLLDRFLTPFAGRPYYCICLEAYKPRFGECARQRVQASSGSVWGTGTELEATEFHDGLRGVR